MNSDTFNSLLIAVKNGCVGTVSCLLNMKSTCVHAIDEYGQTALIIASGLGYKSIVKYLIEHGADVNAVDNNGWTAIMAASWNNHLEVVDLLLANGARVNTVTAMAEEVEAVAS